MTETIEYDDNLIMERFEIEVRRALGQEAWETLTDKIGAPDIHAEPACLCQIMKEFMSRFESLADHASVKTILMRVRHGLNHAQFSGAKEKFAKYNHIDDFDQAERSAQADIFRKLSNTGELFYGQEIDDQVRAFETFLMGNRQPELDHAGEGDFAVDHITPDGQLLVPRRRTG
jgi:hypothetical protein